MIMTCFIKKIFDGNVDELVHLQFQKFSRGSFKNRAIAKATRSAKGFSLTTGPEYANDLVRVMANHLADSESQVTGVVVSTLDLKSKLPYKDIKQFMGIKQYALEGSMKGHDIIKLLDSAPEGFFALTFNVGDTLLKIKPKAPKSAKPKTSDEAPKPDFCSLKTTHENLIKEVVFDAPASWKSIQINHTFNINDIELPKNVDNPNELRRLAKRKGMIVRKMNIDGVESVREKEFVA